VEYRGADLETYLWLNALERVEFRDVFSLEIERVRYPPQLQVLPVWKAGTCIQITSRLTIGTGMQLPSAARASMQLAGSITVSAAWRLCYSVLI
jgi:hypothetical protein